MNSRDVVNEAALYAMRRRGESATLSEFTVAIERIVAGIEKKCRVLAPREREIDRCKPPPIEASTPCRCRRAGR